MARVVSTKNLIDDLTVHKIVAPGVLEQVLSTSGGAALALTPEALIEALVSASEITSFQEANLLSGQVDLLDLGPYLVLDTIGSGGMGTVYRARHRLMNRDVAIKMMNTEASRKPGFIKRFEREVQTLAQLHHPNIVMAFDAGEWQGRPFLVMEFVRGQDLATAVAEHGPLSVAEAVAAISQAAMGLGYAHIRGLVHRDVKPANLLREASGTIKVADLGIARVNAEADHDNSITQAGDFIGSAAYAAPEQALDATTVDRRADIYALGCTCFYLLTGTPPYVSNSLMGLLLMHRERPVPRLSESCPDVPPELDAILSHMLAKSVDDRFQSMAEVVGALETLGRSHTLSTQRPGFASGAPLNPGSEPTEAFQFPGRLHPSPDTQTRAAGSTAHATQGIETHPLARISVLLVEPSKLQARLTQEFCRMLGITRIRVTDSGEEAINCIDKDGPDVVVCAMHLRDMTGSELVRTLSGSRAGRKLAFVVASSDTETAPEDSLEALPKTRLLHKPFSMVQLAAALEQVTSVG